MAVWVKTLRCNLCLNKFKWKFEGFPDECPVCGQHIGVEGRPEVAAPMIALTANKSFDDVYRAMERGSEHRVNVASEMLGVPKAELSEMKITNMRDNARPGENSAPPLTTAQTQLLNASSVHRREGAVSGFSAAESNHPRSGVGASLSQLRQVQRNHPSWGKTGFAGQLRNG